MSRKKNASKAAAESGASQAAADSKSTRLSGWRGKRLWIVCAVFVLIAVAVLVPVFSGSNPLDYFKRLWQRQKSGNYGVISFDDHNFNRYAAISGGLAAATNSGLFVYDMYGEELAAVQDTMSTPFVQANRELVLVCDIGGNTLAGVNAKQETVLDRQLDGTILDADISDGGAACYALCTDGTKTQLTVLDPDQQEIYRWNSETVFFNQCCVSSAANYLVGTSIGQKDGAFESTATIFRTDEEEPVAQLSLGKDLYFGLDFINSGTVCAVGESGVRFFTCEGSESASYDYDGAYLTDFTMDGDGFLALAMNRNKAGNDYFLVTLDSGARELATLDLKERILDLSAAGNYLAVLTGKRMVVYNNRLKVCLETTDTASATHVVARDDGTAFLISGGRALLITQSNTQAQQPAQGRE